MKTPLIAMIGFVLLAVPSSTFGHTPPPQAGWKYLFVNHEENDDNDQRIAFSGPVIGMAFRF